MANARPDRPTSFEEGTSEGEDDHENSTNKSSFDSLSNTKQNGVPPVRNVDRYGFMGGDQYTSPDEIPKVTLDIIRKREVKWVEMFENWEKWMTKRFKRVRARCRKGIPPSLRARAWQYLCGSKFLMDQNQGKFEEYLDKSGDPKWIEDIHKDLHRQFPLHEIFALRGGHGQEDLFRILKAYTIHNPQDGYCQAQGPIAAVLLMHMPAEQAFWCLVSICEKYLPGYYSPGLEAVHIDGDVLFGLLKKSSPLIYKHLKKQKIEPILYMTEWFMCIFSRTLPWTAVLRVWDMFFCEGVKVMFRIALVLFKLTLGTPEKLIECPTLYETMEKLRHIPHELIDGEFISKESLKLNVDEKDMEKEHQHQITKRRKAQSSAKTENNGSKKKRNKRQLENVPGEKKRDNANLTFWKVQNKSSMKETRVENAGMTTAPKPVKHEQPIPQTKFPLPKNEAEGSKKMHNVEMAKALAKEAFTVQQTLKPVIPDAQFPVKEELLESNASNKSFSKLQFQSKPASAQTSSGDKHSSTDNERLSIQTKDQDVSCMQSVTERTLSESSGTNQPEELQINLADEIKLQQQLVEASRREDRLQLNPSDVQLVKSSSNLAKDEKAKIYEITVATAASLEPGELLTCPKLQSPQNTSKTQFQPSDVRRNSLDLRTAKESSQTEEKTSDTYKSESENPHPMHNHKCFDKTEADNLLASCPIKSNQGSEEVASSEEISEELEPLFVNSLLIEPDATQYRSVQELIVNNISEDTANEHVNYFGNKTGSPRKDLVADPISDIFQNVSLDTAVGRIQPQQQSSVAQSTDTKEQDDADLNLVNMHKLLEAKNSPADNEIAIASNNTLVDKSQTFSSELLLSVTSEQVQQSSRVKPNADLAASQQIQSSQSSATNTVEVKIQRLSSTLQMGDDSNSSEFTKLTSDRTEAKKQSAPAEKPLAAEPVFINDLVDAKKISNDPDSKECTRVTEHLVQQLSFQTVQLLNKDASLVPVGSETNLPSKNDLEQIKEMHI